MKIAIDGPAGAGKSTIARIVAAELGFLYLDTGSMYRALTYDALRRGLDLSEETVLARLARALDLRLVPGRRGKAPRVFIGRCEVTRDIRTPEVSRKVSQVASHAQVREAMVRRQRDLASRGSVVMDGRDIGTTVLPDADVKVFLQASVEERARRRSRELRRQGHRVRLRELAHQIAQRDEADTQRAASPLMKAPDAVEIDTTDMSIRQVVQTILELVDRRGS